MNNISLEFSINDILKLVHQLPLDVKTMLIEEWTQEYNLPKKITYPTFHNFSAFNEPIDLKKHAVKKESLDEFSELWADELPAEELCKMLD